MKSGVVMKKRDAFVIIHNNKQKEMMNNCLVKWTKLCVYLLDTTFCTYEKVVPASNNLFDFNFLSDKIVHLKLILLHIIRL